MVVYGTMASATVAVTLIVLGAGMFFIGMVLPVLTEFQIGTSGFSAKLRDRDTDFRATIDPHTEELTQVATLLAGSEKAGEALLERALVDTYMRWREAKREGAAGAVRKSLEDLATVAGQVASGTEAVR